MNETLLTFMNEIWKSQERWMRFGRRINVGCAAAIKEDAASTHKWQPFPVFRVLLD